MSETSAVTLRKAIMAPAQLEQFEMALPSMIDKDRFVRIALTAINKMPLLGECTPASVCTCLLDLASFGLEPDGRRAHLIPFKNNKKGCYESQLIIDYKGLVELGRRSGELSDWYAELVCDKDDFEYVNGQVTHKINFREPRGDKYAVYSCAIFKDGTRSYEVMTKEEVLAIQGRSKAGQNGPWKTDGDAMWKKTVIRRHSKTLPLSSDFRDAVAKDYDAIDITSTVGISEPIMPSAPTLKTDKPAETVSKSKHDEAEYTQIRTILIRINDGDENLAISMLRDWDNSLSSWADLEKCTKKKFAEILKKANENVDNSGFE